jgi:flotillin
MKTFNDAGKDHEEFKLLLEKNKTVELAGIHIQKDIANAQAQVLSEALRSAKIDIVGGENVFFDKIVGAITSGKSLDRRINNSVVLTEVKDQLLDNSSGENLIAKVKGIVRESGIRSEDLKNLSVAAFIAKLISHTEDSSKRGVLEQMLDFARKNNLDTSRADDFGIIED